MEKEDSQNEKAKQVNQKTGKKKQVEKGDDKLFLLGNINSNINIFSQLSSMYQKDKSTKLNEEIKQEDPGVQKTEPIAQPIKVFIEPKNFDFEITKVLGKINKKNDTTKIKAILELKSILEKRDEHFYLDFFSTWVYIYKQFMISEYDKKIIEECNIIFQILATKLRRKILPYLKEIFPYWFLSMNDPNNEVSSIARKTFDSVFTKVENHPQVLALCIEEYLKHIHQNLQLNVQEILVENIHLTEVQAEEVFDRLISCSLNSLIMALEWNTKSAQTQEFINKLLDLLNLNTKITNKNAIVIYLKSKRPKIRACVIEFINSLVKFVEYSNLELNYLIITEYLMDLLEDKDRTVQKALWKECLVNILKILLDKSSSKLDINKYQKKVFECIKNCGFGVGSTMYNHLVEFLSYISQYVGAYNEKFKDSFTEKITFYKNFFESILLGYQHDEIKFFGDNLIGSYFECALFTSSKRLIPLINEVVLKANQNEQKQYLNQVKLLLKDILMNPVLEFIKNNVIGSTLSPYKSIPAQIKEIFNHITSDEESDYFEEFKKSFKAQFQQNYKNISQFENFLIIFKALFGLDQQSILFSFIKEFTIECKDFVISQVGKAFLEEKVGTINDNLIEKNLETIQKAAKFFNILTSKNIVVIDPQDPEFIEPAIKMINDLIKKYLSSVENIIKITNAERFCSQIIKIFNDLCFITKSRKQEQIHKTNNDKLNEIIDIFISILNSGLMVSELSLSIFIPLIYIIDPVCPENYLTEFISYNSNKQGENNLIQKTLDIVNSNKGRDDNIILNLITQASETKINDEYVQKLIRIFNEKVFNSDKFRLFSPFICHATMFSSNEKTNDLFIGVIIKFLTDIQNNKAKINLYFDKVGLIFVLLNFLVKKQKNKILLSEDFRNSVILAHLSLLTILFNLYKFGGNQSTRRIQILYDSLSKLPNDTLIGQNFLKGVKDEVLSLHLSLLKNFIENIFKQEEVKNGTESLQIATLLRMIEDFIKFNLINKNSAYIQKLIKVVLREELFSNSMISPIIWMILMSSLENSKSLLDFNSAFDLKKVDDITEDKFWLILHLISVSSSNSLFLNLKERKFFVAISNNQIIPLLIQVLFILFIKIYFISRQWKINQQTTTRI